MLPTLHKYLTDEPAMISTVLLHMRKLTEEAKEVKKIMILKHIKRITLKRIAENNYNRNIFYFLLLSLDRLFSRKQNLKKISIKNFQRMHLAC